MCLNLEHPHLWASILPHSSAFVSLCLCGCRGLDILRSCWRFSYRSHLRQETTGHCLNYLSQVATCDRWQLTHDPFLYFCDDDVSQPITVIWFFPEQILFLPVKYLFWNQFCPDTFYVIITIISHISVDNSRKSTYTLHSWYFMQISFFMHCYVR